MNYGNGDDANGTPDNGESPVLGENDLIELRYTSMPEFLADLLL